MARETPFRFEPARLDTVPEQLADAVAELTALATALDRALHPDTAASLADLVRIMNTYYSNLIEGHRTRPRDIERALADQYDAEAGRRHLQVEARLHVQVQAWVDAQAAEQTLPEPASTAFICDLHRRFYADAPAELLTIRGEAHRFTMQPGALRSAPAQDNAVGRHLPPSSAVLPEFMAAFEQRYRFEPMGQAARILAMPAAHHRLNFIHPFPDGNGRVSRLMSHAMAAQAGVGAHGLWSISRGLARGLGSRSEYKAMMDRADTPRAGDADGRGNLSLAALVEFCDWFLRVCIDQVRFMSTLFDLDRLAQRLRRYVATHDSLKPEAAHLLVEALHRGKLERGLAPQITGLPERSARRIMADLTDAGLLRSETPKGPVTLRFPADVVEQLFPALYPVA